MSVGMNIKQFAQAYQSKFGSPLKIITVDKNYSDSDGKKAFGKYLDNDDPTNNFVTDSAFISVSRSDKRFGLTINSLDGISSTPVLYKGQTTILSKVR